MVDQATEFYNWNYGDLVRVIGVASAKRKIVNYQSAPLSSNPLIKGCQLLKTFQELGSKVKDLTWFDSSPKFTVEPPHIDPEDFPDPTDRGLTRFPYREAKKHSNQKPKTARRVSQNG
ncbi:MAG: hypothetical protein ACO1O1_13175 [Adhaeribacter sp.]